MEKEGINNNTSLKENKDENNDKNKLNEEDITIGGYGYWKREGDLINNDKFKPTKVENLSTIKNEDKKESQGSAWNSAGTWEEKHYKKNQIEDYFNSNISKKNFKNFEITKMSGYKGDVSLIYLFI